MIISRIGAWCAQRVSSLGFVALIILLYLALWHDRPRHIPRHNPKLGLPGGKIRHPDEQITTSQLIFVWYTLLAHLLALAFPLRLCYATWTTTRKLKRVLKQAPFIPKLEGKTQLRVARNGLLRMPCEDSSSSSASDSEEETFSFFGSKCQTLELLHAIILPNYKEELDTLRETLLVLGSHAQAKSTYEIYLAMESTETGCQAKAKALTEEFKDFFLEIEHTVHPSGLPGEFQGKSSNLSWAAKRINQKYETAVAKRNVIVTVLDADSHLSANHFTFINDLHIRYPLTAETTVYVPPIIFDRNSHLVPTPVRLADLLWAGAGLSGHYESSTICPPTSVYSLPLSLVDRAGGWDAGPEAIGEDLHMYIKCFFALNGNLTVRTILSAASQTNVHTGDPGIRGFYRDCNARYRQALRHMWGALDSGFVVKSVSEMWWEAVRGQSKLRPHWTNTLILAHRMYEAHFLPTHMTLLIIGGSLFMLAYPPTRIPPLLFYTLNMTAYLRICSLFNLGIFFFLYEPYHKTCVRAREQEMQLAGLHDRMIDAFSYRSFRKNMLDYLFFPVAGVAFSSIPTMVALTCHFYTLKLVYRVSKKPSWVKAAVSP